MTSDGLLDVWLLGYPLRLGARASEHYESVYRELTLLASSADERSVPGDLIRLIEEMDRRSARNNASEKERDEALARGETTLDVRLRVPADVVEVTRGLDLLLDEADRYCADGTLLTLAPPEDVVAFREWYLGELRSQVEGEPARPWPGEVS